MGSGKDNVQRKRKVHGAQERASRVEANRKKAKRKEAEKAAAAKRDAANQQQWAIGEKANSSKMVSGSLSSAQLLTGHQVGML